MVSGNISKQNKNNSIRRDISLPSKSGEVKNKAFDKKKNGFRFA
jgi:hypothetical protein